MAPKQGSAQAKVNLDYGRCFHCRRVMPIKYLKQIRFYKGHIDYAGKFHHKLICRACKQAANDIYRR